MIDWGYWGFFLGFFIVGSVFFFSLEVVLVVCVGLLGLDLVISIIVVIVGNVVGGMICYWMGYLGNMEWIEKYFYVKKEKMDCVEWFVYGWGVWMVFFVFIFILGSVIFIVLGMMCVNIWIVIFVMIIGKIFCYVLLVWGVLEVFVLMY